MKIINAFLIPYPKKDKQATDHAKCEPGYIDEGKCFLTDQVPESYCYIMSEQVHMKTVLKRMMKLVKDDQAINSWFADQIAGHIKPAIQPHCSPFRGKPCEVPSGNQTVLSDNEWRKY
jgi:hypothetical protein